MSDKVGQCDSDGPSSQNSFDEPGSFASVDSYDNLPIHSLLLCPAQWTALLESSPISLVRERDLYSASPPTMKVSCSGADVETRQEAVPPVKNDLDNSTATCAESQQEGDHSSGDKKEKEEEVDMNEHLVVEQQESPLSTHLPLPVPQYGGSSSLASDDSSDTTCAAGITDFREEQMVQHEPLVTHTTGCDSSDRGGSTPNTPLSESRLPLSYLTTNLTHSRNISETPSLPPYISSSTSSAYHSRNSSLASQITSDCFDSDSQFTDIDSCIVLQSGRGIVGIDRSVDGRYKFPDSSIDDRRGCYSVCDLSPGKVRIPDHIVVASPLALEDTLKQATTITSGGGSISRSDESFEVKHEASALKSSEWIKRVMAGLSRQSMVHVKVSSKTKHVVHFNVKAGDLIIWEFATKRKDIGLGMSFEPTEVATVESPEPTDDEAIQKKMTSILPILRVNSHTHPVIGSHTATQDGIYEIVFDNSYSRFFAKELFYRITTQPSEPNENYLDQ